MSISENIATVGLHLLRDAGPRDENSFLSPVSISCALAMTYAGAEANTKKEMNQVLFSASKPTVIIVPGMNDQDIHNEFSKLMVALNPTDAQYQLRNVNRIYAQKGFQLMEQFKGIIHNTYKAELHAADFASQAEAVRSEINSYVSKTTNNKINDLIGSGVLDALTRLVLINAIYFKGDWASKFDPVQTENLPFYVTKNSEKKVPMMIAHEEKFQYYETNEVQILGLPYKGDELMFIAILPKKMFGLEEVEAKLDGHKMIDLIKSMRKTHVDVFLPKFKLESSFSLNAVLQKIGIKDMFDMNVADFSGMNGQKDLFVSAVIHKAFIEVNEEGSEAAAATAVVMMARCMPMAPEPTPVFNANHPFIFAIIDVNSSNNLFIGRHAC